MVHSVGRNCALCRWMSALLLNEVSTIQTMGYIITAESRDMKAMLKTTDGFIFFFVFFITRNSNRLS